MPLPNFATRPASIDAEKDGQGTGEQGNIGLVAPLSGVLNAYADEVSHCLCPECIFPHITEDDKQEPPSPSFKSTEEKGIRTIHQSRAKLYFQVAKLLVSKTFHFAVPRRR